MGIGEKNNNIYNSVLLVNLIYYLKFKHSTVFIDDAYSDKILNSTYDLNVFILNYLFTNNTINKIRITKLISMRFLNIFLI